MKPSSGAAWIFWTSLSKLSHSTSASNSFLITYDNGAPQLLVMEFKYRYTDSSHWFHSLYFNFSGLVMGDKKRHQRHKDKIDKIKSNKRRRIKSVASKPQDDKSVLSEQDKRVVAAVITGMNNSNRHNNSNASMSGRIIRTNRTSVSADSAITFDHLGNPLWLGYLLPVLLVLLTLRYAKRIRGTVYICNISTSNRRFIRQVKRLKNVADRFMDPLPCEIDNHADTTCFGKNFWVASSAKTSVSPYFSEYDTDRL